MRIKIKNVKSLKDLERQRRERINDEVIKFLQNNGYPINKLVTDPLEDLINRVHKDNKKVMVETKNETLNKNQVNGRLILTFDLVLYFKERK